MLCLYLESVLFCNCRPRPPSLAAGISIPGIFLISPCFRPPPLPSLPRASPLLRALQAVAAVEVEEKEKLLAKEEAEERVEARTQGEGKGFVHKLLM